IITEFEYQIEKRAVPFSTFNYTVSSKKELQEIVSSKNGLIVDECKFLMDIDFLKDYHSYIRKPSFDILEMDLYLNKHNYNDNAVKFFLSMNTYLYKDLIKNLLKNSEYFRQYINKEENLIQSIINQKTSCNLSVLKDHLKDKY